MVRLPRHRTHLVGEHHLNQPEQRTDLVGVAVSPGDQAAPVGEPVIDREQHDVMAAGGEPDAVPELAPERREVTRDQIVRDQCDSARVVDLRPDPV